MRLNVSQYFPQLTIDMVGGKPLVILTKGVAIDSLTLQRTLLWARGGGKEKKGGVECDSFLRVRALLPPSNQRVGLLT
jgi:hypothetical protein